jgi:ADP-ribosylation factor family
MLPLWPQYYNDCRMVLFVIDASDPTIIPEAGVELYELLREPVLQVHPTLLPCQAAVSLGWVHTAILASTWCRTSLVLLVHCTGTFCVSVNVA